MRRIFGMAILLLGLTVALYPVVSVWRLSSHVVAMVPDTEQLVDSDTAFFPLLDDDFIIGTAVYEGISSSEVTQLLDEAGFTGRWFSPDYGSWQGHVCCGEYDAALARVSEIGDGTVHVEFSAADSDIQGIWWLFAIVGAGFALIGLLIARLPGERIMPFEEAHETELVA